MTFEIAGSIPSLNMLLRRHWGFRRKLQRDWTEWVFWAPNSYVERHELHGHAKRKHKMRVKITAHRYRLLDKDNLYGSTGKICLDALKKAGYIHDDRPEFCEATVEQVQSRAEKIVFELDPV